MAGRKAIEMMTSSSFASSISRLRAAARLESRGVTMHLIGKQMDRRAALV